VAQQNLGSFVPQTSYDLYLGLRPGGPNPVGARYAGLMDEVGIYGRALTSQEVKSIFAAGSAGKCAACARNPGSLAASYGGNGDGNDASGNGANGTPRGGIAFAP